MEPDFLDVLRTRHCKRAFLDRPVPREVLEEVLAAAANAPSTRNSQPWRVAVLMGTAREELAARLCDAFDRLPEGPTRQKVAVLLRLHLDDRGTAAAIGWPGFHLARERARHALESRAAGLPTSQQAADTFACQYYGGCGYD